MNSHYTTDATFNTKSSYEIALAFAGNKKSQSARNLANWLLAIA
jgi:hypothetical protein